MRQMMSSDIVNRLMVLTRAREVAMTPEDAAIAQEQKRFDEQAVIDRARMKIIKAKAKKEQDALKAALERQA